MLNYDYNKTSAESILIYAEKLIWTQILSFLPKDFKDKKSNKGWIWQLIETHYFWKKLDNESQPDFPEAWVEVKATTIKRIKKWEIRAKERLVLNIINYFIVVNENWESSSFLKKNSLILLIIYLYEEKNTKLENTIEIVELFSFKEYKEDYEIIKNDWLIIQNKIKGWKAHELSEWDTQYLWACTKGSTWWSPRFQPKSGILAKQRAFSFKQGYMNFILKRIEWEQPRYERLFKVRKPWFDFESELKKLFKPYIWKTIEYISNKFDIINNWTNPKQFYSILSNKILWVTNNENIEEFNKANIKLKTTVQTPSWNLRENISFPAFKISDLINEKWEDSEIYNTLESQKFFFVVFKITTKTESEFDRLSPNEQAKNLILSKVVLWNTPSKDIEEKAKPTWEKTIKIIKEWVVLTPKQTKSKIIIQNNLPAKSETEMIHVRPHWVKWDIDILPGWRGITKQCFWFNRDYIIKELWI